MDKRKVSACIYALLLAGLIFVFLYSQKAAYFKTAYQYHSHNVESTASTTVRPKNALNVNTASVEELMKLPHFSRKMAESLVRFREEVSAFVYPEDIIYVKGLGEKIFERIKDSIYAE